MTPPIVQRLRDAAATMQEERVSMQAMARAHGPEAHGTLLLLMAMPCLLPVPGVGTVLWLGMAALAVAMWRGHHGQRPITAGAAIRRLGWFFGVPVLAEPAVRVRHSIRGPGTPSQTLAQVFQPLAG